MKQKDVIDALNALGIPAYLTGGAVRDSVMGVEPHDFDFATPLLPDEIIVRAKAAGRRVILQGKKFGTVKVKLMIDGEPLWVEVTTFRQDGSGRKPEVTFVSDITADLSRRDFTINAMAISPEGKLIDPFDGQADIADGILRTVGNPTLRFKEDPLRMLRLFRFQAKLGFDIDDQTFKKAAAHAHRILDVSKERWVQELDVLLVQPFVAPALLGLWESGLMQYMIPELAPQYGFDQLSPWHELPLHEHTISVVRHTPNDVHMRWAALLHDVGKPAAQTFKREGHATYIKHELIGAELVDSIALRLKWSKDGRETIKSLVKHHLEDDSPLREADNASKKGVPNG